MDNKRNTCFRDHLNESIPYTAYRNTFSKIQSRKKGMLLCIKGTLYSAGIPVSNYKSLKSKRMMCAGVQPKYQHGITPLIYVYTQNSAFKNKD